ncbi:MAG: serine/threonine protein kinase [Oligosphaeraceae bacterium]|nr:serine/threonine protein kinase [Oligosphaeraceae bacterium]
MIQASPIVQEPPHTEISDRVRHKKQYTLAPGVVLGKHTIIKPLGHGGMGEVYLALHDTLQVQRAIKILPNQEVTASARARERFMREARLAIQLDHPNIVQVVDADVETELGLCYIVMEYVDGGTARSMLKATGPLPEKRALLLALKVSEALLAAEKMHLVHRDIKPDNIMLSRNGVVKLADLGIAKCFWGTLPEERKQERSGMTGTPAYISPEQALDPDNLDIRSDFYSLGVTLYELLTGIKPYQGAKTIDIIKQTFHQSVPDPRAIAPKLSKACALLVMRLMAKEAADRPADAATLRAEILDVLNGREEMPELVHHSGSRHGTAHTVREPAAAGHLRGGHDWLRIGMVTGLTLFVCQIILLLLFDYLAEEPRFFRGLYLERLTPRSTAAQDAEADWQEGLYPVPGDGDEFPASGTAP